MKKITKFAIAFIASVALLTGCGSASGASGKDILITTETPTEKPTEAQTEVQTESPAETMTDIDFSQFMISDSVYDLGCQVLDITDRVLHEGMDHASAADLISNLAALDEYKPVTTEDQNVHDYIDFIMKELSFTVSYSEQSMMNWVDCLKTELNTFH